MEEYLLYWLILEHWLPTCCSEENRFQHETWQFLCFENRSKWSLENLQISTLPHWLTFSTLTAITQDQQSDSLTNFTTPITVSLVLLNKALIHLCLTLYLTFKPQRRVIGLGLWEDFQIKRKGSLNTSSPVVDISLKVRRDITALLQPHNTLKHQHLAAWPHTNRSWQHNRKPEVTW